MCNIEQTSEKYCASVPKKADVSSVGESQTNLESGEWPGHRQFENRKSISGVFSPVTFHSLGAFRYIVRRDPGGSSNGSGAKHSLERRGNIESKAGMWFRISMLQKRLRSPVWWNWWAEELKLENRRGGRFN